jgi:hypothetical protein
LTDRRESTHTMDHTNLAQRFNEATDALAPMGHGVLVNRARRLLGDGDVAGVVGFLRDAGRRQNLPLLGKLAGAVEDWQTAGGQPTELVRQPAWKQGRERGEAVATRIGELTGQAGLDALIETLVTEQRAQAALPGDRLTGPQPLASIFPGGEKVAPTAVVEADSHLVAVPLNLDDEPAPARKASDDRNERRPAVGRSPEPDAHPERPPLPRSPSRPAKAVPPVEAPRTVGDRPTSAPPMPLTSPSTAPPRLQVETASVPLAPEAVEEGPTQVTEPVFEEIVEAAAVSRTPPKVPGARQQPLAREPAKAKAAAAKPTPGTAKPAPKTPTPKPAAKVPAPRNPPKTAAKAAAPTPTPPVEVTPPPPTVPATQDAGSGAALWIAFGLLLVVAVLYLVLR